MLSDPLKLRRGLKPVLGIPASGLTPHESDLTDLRLSGRTIDLTIDSRDSAFGDCINVVDAPGEEKLDPELPAFGWSGEQLLGGFAMALSPLSGSMSVEFGETEGERIPFRLSAGRGMKGEDGWLKAPCGYMLRTSDNRVRDAHPRSRGYVDVRTGRIFDFHYHVVVRNSALELLLDHNPDLIPPPLYFPGIPHSGHVVGWMSRGSTGLEFRLAAGLFLPMGESHGGRDLRMPPSEVGASYANSFRARNSSLHPYLFLRAAEGSPESSVHATGSATRKCGERAEKVLAMENSCVELELVPSRSYFGDEFDLHTADLGGAARGQSPLFGGLAVQFGPAAHGKMPFVVRFLCPLPEFGAKQRPVLDVLPQGTAPGLVGMAGGLSFPRADFEQRELAFFADPYKLSMGFLDIETGEINAFVMRSFLFLNVLKQLMIVEPRTPSDSFAFLCTGRLDIEPAITLRLSGSVYVPYPSGYRFPMPGLRSTKVSASSHLAPFVHLEATRACTVPCGASCFELRGGTLRRGLGKKIERLSLDGDTVSYQLRGRTPSRVLPVSSSEVLVTGRGEEERLIKCRLGAGIGQSPWAAIFAIRRRADKAELLAISTDESLDRWQSSCECEPAVTSG